MTQADKCLVAVITGAGSGIGRATAIEMHNRGYRVALVGRRIEALRETGEMLGSDEDEMWCAVAADLADESQAQKIANRVVWAFERIDVLINNAGSVSRKKIGDHPPMSVNAVFGINALAPINTTIGALSLMLENERSAVINVSSMASVDPFPGLSVYGCAKAAMNAFSKGLANEYAERGLIAYTIAPGAVETQMLRNILDETMVPPEACLSPEDIARVIADCAQGKRDEPNGSTIFFPSPEHATADA